MTGQELIDKYLAGERYFIKANLNGANLNGADLSRANLSGANLRGADLRGADLDFSAWPLHCGGLRVKIDRKIAAQLAYHFCAQECEDADYIKARSGLIEFANTFHRVGECGLLQANANTEVLANE